MCRPLLLFFLPASVLLTPAIKAGLPEAVEVGAKRFKEFPAGKEADAIVGDFLLRNNLIEAVVSHNTPRRRANMGTFYGDGGETPGCLYDLTLRETDNDQLTIFAPLNQRGPVSYVRVAKDGQDGEAQVETIISAPTNKDIYKEHRYTVQNDWQGILISSSIRNEGTKPVIIRTAPPKKNPPASEKDPSEKKEKGPRRIQAHDIWTKFSVHDQHADISWADAVDPADKSGYAFSWIEQQTTPIPAKEVTLSPGQSLSVSRFLAVGRSPAEAYGVVAALKGDTGACQGRVVNALGKPCPDAVLTIQLADKKEIRAYPDAKGAFLFRLPTGSFPVKITAPGRNTVEATWDVTKDGALEKEIELNAQSSIAFNVTDEAGNTLPCKAQFIGIGETKTPDLGPANRAHGCVDQYHSESGRFEVPLAPGNYEVIVTRGIEFSHARTTVKVEPGKQATVSARLRRLVDTTGWIRADFHNHSTPSGDNTCGTDDRLINLAAEH
ncbi:MAG: carboxypeptidase-like regulatory domain-containing protein, partial [Verrucomicrobiota bacterium]